MCGRELGEILELAAQVLKLIKPLSESIIFSVCYSTINQDTLSWENMKWERNIFWKTVILFISKNTGKKKLWNSLSH